MNLAAAQLDYLRKANTSAVDRNAGVLAQALGRKDAGIMFAARMDQAFAILGGFSGTTASDLHAFQQSKIERCRRALADYSADAPGTALARTEFGLAPATVPNAFAMRVRNDYAIGADDAMFDLLTVLTVAAFVAYSQKDIGIYDRYCQQVFGLYYLAPHPSILDAFEALAGHLRGSFAGYQAMISDIREMHMRFLIGHECAHIALGHFQTEGSATFEAQPGALSSNVSAFEHYACEYAADAWAIGAMARHAKGNPRLLIAASQTPVLTLVFLQHLNVQAEALNLLAKVMRLKHPPEADRRERLAVISDELIRSERISLTLIREVADFVAEGSRVRTPR